MRLVLFLLPALLLAQAPKIGIIEVYGTHSVSAAEVRKVLGAEEGGQLPGSKAELEEQIEQIPNIVTARLEAACCAEGDAILYVGIEEKGAPHFAHRSPPETDLEVPAEVSSKYKEFLEAAKEAGRAGTAAEDLTQGHSLLQDEKARYVQLGFVGLAEQHLATLKKVVREAADPEQRAIAVYVLGYAKDKSAIHDDLQYALRDPDETVRANALRALAALTVFARKNPKAGVKVSPTWLIEMLNSVVWTDRNNAAIALVTLTEDRDDSMLQQIRERALPAVIEMAKWRHLPHALPAFILAGRIGGLPEAKIQEAWNNEQREPVIEAALSSGKK
jgi:hypothetical protein